MYGVAYSVRGRRNTIDRERPGQRRGTGKENIIYKSTAFFFVRIKIFQQTARWRPISFSVQINIYNN
jgi:hypothetical protein